MKATLRIIALIATLGFVGQSSHARPYYRFLWLLLWRGARFAERWPELLLSHLHLPQRPAGACLGDGQFGTLVCLPGGPLIRSFGYNILELIRW